MLATKRFFQGSTLTLTLALLLAACGGPKAGGPAKTGGDSPDSDSSGKGDTTSAAGTDASGPGDGAESTTDTATAPALPALESNKQLEEKRAMSARIKLVLTTADGSTGGMSDKSWSFSEDRRSGLEKTDKSAATQLNVLFGKRNKSGLDSWTTLPTEGKGYVIRGKGSELAVLDNGKSEASAAEREIVVAEYGFVGRQNPLLAAVYQAKEKGATESLSPEAYRWLLGHTPELQVGEVKLSYQGNAAHAGRDTGKLEIDLTGSMKDGATSYDYELKGPGLVDLKTGYVVDLKLTGKVKVTGSMTLKGRKLTSTGDGEMTLTRTGKIN